MDISEVLGTESSLHEKIDNMQCKQNSYILAHIGKFVQNPQSNIALKLFMKTCYLLIQLTNSSNKHLQLTQNKL